MHAQYRDLNFQLHDHDCEEVGKQLIVIQHYTDYKGVDNAGPG